MGECPSGQRSQAVNLVPSGYGGSNPTLPHHIKEKVMDAFLTCLGVAAIIFAMAFLIRSF